jgi:mRNA interferase HigB
MVIISKTILVEAGRKYPDLIDSINDWYKKAKKANWNSLEDIKQTFNSVDYVKNDRYVFNIKGNTYRLVAMIFFNRRTMYIRFIGTHAEYDKIDSSII